MNSLPSRKQLRNESYEIMLKHYKEHYPDYSEEQQKYWAMTATVMREYLLYGWPKDGGTDNG